jgi:hypothetical protein
MDLGQMPFKEVFVAKGTGAMLMWADVISVAQMNHVVVRREGFHLCMALELIETKHPSTIVQI